MLRVTLAIVASIVVSAAAPIPTASAGNEVLAPCTATSTGSRATDCYGACFHACIAKGGTVSECEFQCSESPPCLK